MGQFEIKKTIFGHLMLPGVNVGIGDMFPSESKLRKTSNAIDNRVNPI